MKRNLLQTVVWLYTVLGIYSCEEAVASKESKKAILSFTFESIDAKASLKNDTFFISVPSSTDLSRLTPTITISEKANVSPASGVVQDFGHPLPYTVIAEDGSYKTYIVKVELLQASGGKPDATDPKDGNSAKASDAKDITQFSVGEKNYTVSGTNITYTYPSGTDISALRPNITLSPNATVSPLSGSSQDFRQNVTYTVTAQNKSTKTYTVTITVSSVSGGGHSQNNDQVVDTRSYSEGLANQPADWLANLPDDIEIGNGMSAAPARKALPVNIEQLITQDSDFNAEQRNLYLPALKRALPYAQEVKIDITAIPLTGGYPFANVQRVNRIYTELYEALPSSEQNSLAGKTKAERYWMYLMPNYNKKPHPTIDKVSGIYRYRNFLKAIAMYPDLCNDKGIVSSQDEACKIEMATMFAHFQQEVAGLLFVIENGCPGTTAMACAYPDSYGAAGKKYYGRGAKQLSYPVNYFNYSMIVFGNDNIRNNPDLVEQGWNALLSAVYFYMTGQDRKPSIHDVMVKNWVPDANDISAGRLDGFGTTINIINGGLECGSGSEDARAANRGKHYNTFRTKLGLSTTTTNIGCANAKQFADTDHLEGRWSKYPSGFSRDWNNSNSISKCGLVSYTTQGMHPLISKGVSTCESKYP